MNSKDTWRGARSSTVKWRMRVSKLFKPKDGMHDPVVLFHESRIIDLLAVGIALIDFADSVCKILPPAMRAIQLIATFPSQTVGGIGALSKRLDVGANDIADPTDFRIAVDFVDTGFFLAKTILQSFYCDIESDFVPKFETVGDGLRG